MGNASKIKKEGWNWESFWKSVVWYYRRGMRGKAWLMIFIIVLSLGVGLIPVMVYCGAKGNSDFYYFIKRESIII